MKENISPIEIDRLLEHQDFVKRLARSLVHDDSRADDLTQETWLVALRHPPHDDRSLRGWLASVVRHTALNTRRAESRRNVREHLAAQPEDLPPADVQPQCRQVKEKVVEAVSTLREPMRTAVMLRYLDGLQPSEIAKRLDCKVETVRTRVHRGVLELRGRLDAEYGDRRAWSIVLTAWIDNSPGVATVAAASAGTTLVSRMTWAAGILGAVFGGWLLVVGAKPDVIEVASPSATPERLSVAALEAADAGERTLVVSDSSPQPSAFGQTVRGQVLDIATKAAVPDLTAVLTGADGLEEVVVTDIYGFFESEELFVSGEVSVEFEDGLERRAIAADHESFHFAADANSDVARFLVESGLTVSVSFDPPLGYAHDDFQLRLDKALPLKRLHHKGEPVELRGEGPYWARVPEPPQRGIGYEAGRSQYRVGVYSKDGLWRGSRVVHAFEGVHPELLTLELHELGTLRGRLVDSDGHPVGGVRLYTWPADSERDGMHRILIAGETVVDTFSRYASDRLTYSGPDGAFLFEARDPGAWMLDVDSIHYELEPREVSLEGGSSICVEVVVPAKRESMVIAGTLLSQVEGRYFDFRSQMRLFRREGDKGLVAQVALDTSKSGRASFRFEDIPPGSYVVVPSPRDFFALEPRWAFVDAETEELEFTSLDGGPSQNFGFRVFDAQTREPVEVFDDIMALVDRQNRGASYSSTLEGRAFNSDYLPGDGVVGPVPAGVDFHWTIRAEGYQVAEGDRSSFPEGREVSVLDVFLERTHSLEFVVREFGNQRPLAGVIATCDREMDVSGRLPLAESVADGRITLELPYDPGKLYFDKPGWHVVRWSGFENGRQVEELEVYEVWMQPTE